MRTSVAVSIALVLAGCTHHDVETRPFHLRITLPDGSGLEQGLTGVATVVLTGTARRQDDTTLVVQGVTLAAGAAPIDVTISFRPDASPGVAFPPQLDGAPVSVVVNADPAQLGPEGEPLPLFGLAIATGADTTLHYQFMLGEFPPPAAIFVVGDPNADVPAFQVIGDAAEFEPAKCGAVYYDVLRVYGTAIEISLRHGDQGTMPVGGGPVWNVRHVLSWHRDGACAGQLSSWTQIAAWR